MKFILLISVLLLILIVVGGLRMSFSTFCIEMKDWVEALKFILFIVLFALCCGYHEVKGFKEGYNKAIEDAVEAIEKFKKERMNEGKG